MQLREEVGELTAMAEAADQADGADGMSIPEELARVRSAWPRPPWRAIIEAWGKERWGASGPGMRQKQRAAKSAKTGKKPGGRLPAPQVEAPGAADQVKLTGEELRIMPVATGGFEQVL